MRTLPKLTALAASAALALSPVLSGSLPTAYAESSRGQLTYSCDTAARGYESEAIAYPFVTALQVEVPDQVVPGQTIAISGVFSIQFPEELRSLAEDYFTYAQGVSDVLTIPVTVGGRTTRLKTSRFDSGKVTTRNQPLILSSPVTAQSFTVPGDASGEVVIELPENNTVKSNINGKQVAFHAEALLSGGTVATFVDEYVYKAACTHPANGNRVVARIPVATADETDPDTPSAPTPSQGATLGTTPATGPGEPAPTTDTTPGPGQTESTAPGAPQPGATAQPAPGATQTATTQQVLAPREDGVRVPDWVLLLGAGLLILAALLLAGWSHHRVRMLRAELEG